MRAYKSIDFLVQIGLLIMILIGLLIGDPEKLNAGVFLVSFGVVQIISILVHFSFGNQPWKIRKWRKYHLIGTAIVLLLIVIALVQDSTGRSGDKDDKYSMPGLETIFIATIPAILLSLFYTVITWIEWKKIKEIK